MHTLHLPSAHTRTLPSDTYSPQTDTSSSHSTVYTPSSEAQILLPSPPPILADYNMAFYFTEGYRRGHFKGNGDPRQLRLWSPYFRVKHPSKTGLNLPLLPISSITSAGLHSLTLKRTLPTLARHVVGLSSWENSQSTTIE